MDSFHKLTRLSPWLTANTLPIVDQLTRHTYSSHATNTITQSLSQTNKDDVRSCCGWCGKCVTHFMIKSKCLRFLPNTRCILCPDGHCFILYTYAYHQHDDDDDD
jgi:hypothetical protein